MVSIMNTDPTKCFICGRRGSTECHHIFPGANRKRSDRDGMTVYLCHYCHNEPPTGVHQNRAIRRQLQAIAQRRWMEFYNKTEDEFRAAYGRSYIEE